MEDQMSDNNEYRHACLRVVDDKAERTNAVLQPCKQRKLGVVAGKRRSLVWQHFDILADQGKLRAQCKYCRDTNYRAEGYFGTSNCQKHLKNCKAYKTVFNRKLIADNPDRVANGFDEKVYCKLFADAILLHGCPLSIIENEGLRKLLAYLNPKVDSIPSSDVKKIVEGSGITPKNGLSDQKKAKEEGVIVVNDSDADVDSLVCFLD